MPARVETPRLCFVLAPAFHGATILSLLLNNSSEISALGDTNPSREIEQRCSCGEPVLACEFWGTIAARAGADRFAELSLLLPTLPSSLQRRHVELRLRRLRGGSAAEFVSRAVGRAIDEAARAQWRFGRDPGGWLDTWHRFYASVAELQGTSLVVDGEKNVLKAALLSRATRPDPSVAAVHLVRDPRGYVNSWRRHYGAKDLCGLARFWARSHRRAEQLASLPRYCRVRYEDLASSPNEEISSLFRVLGVKVEQVVGPPRRAEKHHLIGNIMLSDFAGQVALDERWRTDLSQSEQRDVLRSAGDLAAAYGYLE